MKKIKYFYYCILLVSFFGSSIVFAYPNWIELGTYVIEDYDSWNSGSWDLPGGFASSADLWSAINDYCTNSYRTWRVTRTDYAVTDASLYNPAGSPNYTREYCDFLFIWPHAHAGNLGNVHLASNPNELGKVSLSTGNVRLGTMYNRWVYDNGCSTLLNYANFWSEWNNAFEGLQVYFGFVSHGWGTSWVGDAMAQMIVEWTHPVNTTIMASAFFHGMKNQVYLNGGLSIEPGLLTSGPGGYQIDFAFRTYAQATSESGGNPGLKMTVVYGTPDYD